MVVWCRRRLVALLASQNKAQSHTTIRLSIDEFTQEKKKDTICVGYGEPEVVTSSSDERGVDFSAAAAFGVVVQDVSLSNHDPVGHELFS